MVGLVLGLLLLSTPIETYNRGRELFKTSYYEQAAALLSLFVEDPGSAPQKTIVSARWMLAQAQFFTDDKAGAAKQVKLLHKLNADLPDDLPPAFERFVTGLKPETVLKPDPPPIPKRERPKSQHPVVAKPVEQPSSAVIAAQPSTQPGSMEAPIVLRPPPSVPPWYVRGIPGGVGHMIAKDYVAGGIFMTLTVASAVLNIVFLALNAKALQPGASAASANRGFYIAQHVSAGLFYATLITSLIDGIAGVPARAEKR